MTREMIHRGWKETFQMTMNEDGRWTWEPFWEEHWKMIDDYNELARLWNKHLPLINGRTQPIGRPVAASEAQQVAVLKLRRAGRSLRGIAEDTSLSFSTVRTIVGRRNGTDRTTVKHRARIELDRQQAASRKRRKRTGEGLCCAIVPH